MGWVSNWIETRRSNLEGRDQNLSVLEESSPEDIVNLEYTRGTTFPLTALCTANDGAACNTSTEEEVAQGNHALHDQVTLSEAGSSLFSKWLSVESVKQANQVISEMIHKDDHACLATPPANSWDQLDSDRRIPLNFANQLTPSDDSEGSAVAPVQVAVSAGDEQLPRDFDPKFFFESIRAMQWRAFQRWHRGSHERTWSVLSAATMGLITGVLNLTVWQSACDISIFSVNVDSTKYLPITSFSIVAALFVIYLTFSTVKFSRYSVYVSLVFLGMDLVYFIGLVVVSSPASQPETERRLLLEGSTRLNQRIPVDFLTTSESKFLGELCSKSFTEYVVWHWFILTFYASQFGLVVFDVSYTHIFWRLASWYYLKSFVFEGAWQVSVLMRVRLYAPVLPMDIGIGGDLHDERNTSWTPMGTAVHEKGGLNAVEGLSVQNYSPDNKEKAGSSVSLGSQLQQPRVKVVSGIHIECIGLSFGRALCRSLFRLQEFRTRHTQNMGTIGSWKNVTLGASDPASSNARRTIIFTGEVDSYGQPHGFGYWGGFESSGERLVGYWDRGIPSGPFKTREIGSGSGFMCVCIGWAKYDLVNDRMDMGVAKIESSVSGKFFKGFPRVTFLRPPEEPVESSNLFSIAKRRVFQLFADQSMRRKSAWFSDYSNEEQHATRNGVTMASSVHMSSDQTGCGIQHSHQPQVASDFLEKKTFLSPVSVSHACSRYYQEKDQLIDTEARTRNRFSSVGMGEMDAHFSPGRSSQSNRVSFNSRLRSPPTFFKHEEDHGYLIRSPPKSTKSVRTTHSRHSDIEILKEEIRVSEAAAPKSLKADPLYREQSLKVVDEEVVQFPSANRREGVTPPCSPSNKKGKEHDSPAPGLIESRSEVHIDSSTLRPSRRRPITKEGHERRGGAILGAAQDLGAGAVSLVRAAIPEAFRRKRGPQSRRHLLRMQCEWVLEQLSPHTPNFGLQARSELTISVDRERGVSILGLVPVSDLLSEQRRFMAGNRQRSTVGQNSMGVSSNASADPSVDSSPREPIHNRPPMAEGSATQKSIHIKVHRRPLLGEPIMRHAPHVSSEPRQSPVINDDQVTTTMTAPVQEAQVRAELNTPVFAPELEAQGWVPMETIGTPEILLYVHGYNNSHYESCQVLGQMCAFGNFPDHLKVFVFSWPAGHGFYEFYIARKAAEDIHTHTAFMDLLVAFQENGVRQLHVLCHSMGARLFLRAMRHITSKFNLFWKTSLGLGIGEQSSSAQEVEDQRAIELGLLRIQTVTFLNPEYFTDEFVSRDYWMLRELCANISIYADANDKPLFWSQTFAGRAALGRSVFGMYCSPEMIDPSVVLRANQKGLVARQYGTQTASPAHAEKALSSSSASDQMRVSIDERTALRMLDQISLFEVEGRNDEPGTDEVHEAKCFPDEQTRAQARTRWIRNPLHVYKRYSARPPTWRASQQVRLMLGMEFAGWLDMDVIDTTFMDQNVHSMRHSYWGLNREIIEDIRELLITRKRAKQRTGRLDRRDANVWVFRVAPSFLTSIFSI